MTQPDKNKLPGLVYAAAGAGDLVYQKLRKVPAAIEELSEKTATRTAELRERVRASSAGLRERARASSAEWRKRTTGGRGEPREKAIYGRDQLRELARSAQVKATAFYNELVARGVRVIGGNR